MRASEPEWGTCLLSLCILGDPYSIVHEREVSPGVAATVRAKHGMEAEDIKAARQRVEE